MNTTTIPASPRFLALGSAIALLVVAVGRAPAQVTFDYVKVFQDSQLQYPNAVMEGSDGVLYGLAETSSSSPAGRLFKVKKDGSGFAVVHQFPTNETGFAPSHFPLVEASDGMLC